MWSPRDALPLLAAVSDQPAGRRSGSVANMGAMDAMAVGSAVGLPFIFIFLALVYTWFKRNQRFDEEVMIECARRSGGAQSEAMIRQELAGIPRETTSE